MIIKKLRIFLWGFLVLVVVWILLMNVVPSGKIIYINDFSNEYSEFVRKLTPDERVGPVENGMQKIFGNPVYFDLRVPRRFTYAKMIIKYKNNTNLPIMEIGVLMNKKLWQYNLVPLQNKVLDELLKNWLVVRDNDLILLQRPDLSEDYIYSSVDDFKKNLPVKEKIALYNIDLDNEYILDNYKSSDKENDLGLALQGAYQFYTYLKDEKLNFIFSFTDLNEHKGSDEIIINLYYQNQIIDSLSISDDGIVNDKGKQSEIQTIKLTSANLPEGLYKVEISASDDIVTNNIKTSQNKISFINKVWIANAENNINLFTDSLKINLQTINPDSLQTIKVANEDLILENTYKQKSIITAPGIKKINFEKGGVIVSGNGVFALSESNLINPQYRRVDESIDLDKEGIDYVLARYQPPQQNGDWLTSKIEFDLSSAYKEFFKHKFIISIPGLRIEDGMNDYIEIDKIQVELEGMNLWEKILNIFK